jgi:hypothetical protein
MFSVSRCGVLLVAVSEECMARPGAARWPVGGLKADVRDAEAAADAGGTAPPEGHLAPILTVIPPELFLYILSFLPVFYKATWWRLSPVGLSLLRLVCRVWRREIRSTQIDRRIYEGRWTMYEANVVEPRRLLGNYGLWETDIAVSQREEVRGNPPQLTLSYLFT